MTAAKEKTSCTPCRVAVVVLLSAVAVVLLPALCAYLWWYTLDGVQRAAVLDSWYRRGVRLRVADWDGSTLLPGKGLALPDSLDGQTVVITGGTKGCGFYAAQRFKKLGAHVILSGRTAGSSGKAASALASTRKGSATGLPLDLEDLDSVHSFARSVVAARPSIDVLIMNGATNHDETQPPENVEEYLHKSGINRIYFANHLGHFYLAVLLAPHLVPNGRIVVVSSLAAWFGNPFWMMLNWGSPPKPFKQLKKQMMGGGDARSARRGGRMYGTSKLANLVTARLLRKKLAKRNITVTAMTPGLVDTDLNKRNKGFIKSQSVPGPRGGQTLFESAYVSKQPTPDFLYPYWMPWWVFQYEAPITNLKRHTLESRGYLYRPESMQKLNYNLHASIGPEVPDDIADKLWRWSRDAVGLPASLDDGDVFEAASGLARVARVAAPGVQGGKGRGVEPAAGKGRVADTGSAVPKAKPKQPPAKAAKPKPEAKAPPKAGKGRAPEL